MDDRGVSEVVGFILVFSLVLGTITLVYTGGLANLQDTRDGERVGNAERAFDVLANNLESVARDQAPSRATEIKLADAQLETRSSTTIAIELDGGQQYSAGPRPIVYSADGPDSTIVYEAGAVIRTNGDDARMIRTPDYIFGPERTVIRVVDTSGGIQSVGGSTTALVRAEQRSRGISYWERANGGTVTFNVSVEPESGLLDVWEQYLDEALTEAYDSPTHSCDQHGERVVCENVETESIYYAVTNVRITLI